LSYGKGTATRFATTRAALEGTAASVFDLHSLLAGPRAHLHQLWLQRHRRQRSHCEFMRRIAKTSYAVTWTPTFTGDYNGAMGVLSQTTSFWRKGLGANYTQPGLRRVARTFGQDENRGGSHRRIILCPTDGMDGYRCSLAFFAWYWTTKEGRSSSRAVSTRPARPTLSQLPYDDRLSRQRRLPLSMASTRNNIVGTYDTGPDSIGTALFNGQQLADFRPYSGTREPHSMAFPANNVVGRLLRGSARPRLP